MINMSKRHDDQSPKYMELSEIHAFVAVGESGSVNRAAHKLYLSQPAVTRRVQRLETALGVALLDRRAKPLTLTPAGQIVLEQCRNVLRSIEDLRASLGDDGPAGEFRLGAVYSLADLVFAEPADRLRRLFPGITFRLTTGWSQVLLEQVREGALDAAIAYLPEGGHLPAGIAGQFIAATPFVLIAPRRRRLGRIVDLVDVADEDWVLNPDGCGFRATLRRMLQGVNAPLRVAVEAHGLDLQLSLVARGAGLGLAPARMLRRSRFRSQVRPFRIRGHDFRVAAWTVYGRLPVAFTPVVTALSTQLVRAWTVGEREARNP